jgi:hypothetical protein
MADLSCGPREIAEPLIVGPKHDDFFPHVSMLALASRCLMLMYKVAICHPSTKCYAISSGTLFPISGGQPALPVPSPAAISLL